MLWAARDGGGIYRSTDGGQRWENVATGVGENLAQALAVDFSVPDGVLMGTATAGVWALRPNIQPVTKATAVNGRAGVDARIEVVWPHDFAPVTEADQANIGLRLFAPGSLVPPACGWQPKAIVWLAANTDPIAPLDSTEQRSVDGQPFPYWNLNDVDVSGANDPSQKLYFMVRVAGVDTATSVWAHGADPRTYFPQPDVPSGTATDGLDAVDAPYPDRLAARRGRQSPVGTRGRAGQCPCRFLQAWDPTFGTRRLAAGRTDAPRRMGSRGG